MDSEPSPETLRKMRELPPDWWQNAFRARRLVEVFKGHVLPLLIAGSDGQHFQSYVYTGLLLDTRDTTTWLTAGHVVANVQAVLSSPGFRITQMAWLDGFPNSAASAVPLHRRHPRMNSWTEQGLDIGVICPSILDIGNIRLNSQVHPIDPRIWKNIAAASPEGYYGIGYPAPWVSHTERAMPNKKVLHSIKANIACLPLRPLAPQTEGSSFEGHCLPDEFHGQILPFLDDPDFKVEEVQGMSGGPIFSVERDPTGRIRYRLVGIIKSWSPPQSIIHAEPVARVAKAIDDWLGQDPTDLLVDQPPGAA